MNRYYLAQVVTQEAYNRMKIGDAFGSGRIVEGLSHEKDLILVTVHEEEESFRAITDGTTGIR